MSACNGSSLINQASWTAFTEQFWVSGARQWLPVGTAITQGLDKFCWVPQELSSKSTIPISTGEGQWGKELLLMH